MTRYRLTHDPEGWTLTPERKPTVNIVKRYRKRPVTVEAVQWDGTAEGATPIINWILDSDYSAGYWAPGEWDDNETNTPYMRITTLEGNMLASRGDWIIRGVQGEVYPCKDAIFRDTYQPADDHVEGEQPDPTYAEVWAAAEAIARCTFPDKGWWELSLWQREEYTRRAIAALAAARKAGRHE